MKKVLSGVIFLAALLLIFNNRILGKVASVHADKSQEVFQTIGKEELKKNQQAEASFEVDAIDDIDLSKTYLKFDDSNKDSIIGKLVIPKTETNVILFEGISKEKLWQGVSTMKKDQSMGEGNFSIAGHYGINGELFHNLDELEADDEIRMTDKDKIYIYRVYDKKLVDPEDVYMIEDHQAEAQGGPIISLMNCYYENGRNSGKRLFVLGELDRIIDYDEDIIDKKIDIGDLNKK